MLVSNLCFLLFLNHFRNIAQSIPQCHTLNCKLLLVHIFHHMCISQAKCLQHAAARLLRPHMSCLELCMEKDLHTCEYVLSRSLGHVIRAVHYAENDPRLSVGSATQLSQRFRLVFDWRLFSGFWLKVQIKLYLLYYYCYYNYNKWVSHFLKANSKWADVLQEEQNV